MTESRLTPRRRFGLAVLTLAGVLSVATIAQAQPALQPPTVNGPQVHLAWSAVPNAESYVLRVGVVPGVYLINHDFGNVTTGMVAAPLTGTFYAVIQPVVGGAPFGPPSNEIQIVVTSLFLPPAPPTNLEVFYDGRTAHFSWAPGVGGGAPLGYLLQATSGGVLVASLPVVSILAMIWLWRDTGDSERIAAHAQATFWYVLPSLPLFLILPALLRNSMGFYMALAVSCAVTVVLYGGMVWTLRRFGISF